MRPRQRLFRALDPLVAHFFREPVLHLRLVLRLGGGGPSGLAEVAEQPQEVQMDAVQVLRIRGREPGATWAPTSPPLGTGGCKRTSVIKVATGRPSPPGRPRLLGERNVYPGRDGATTVKASRASPPQRAGSVKSGNELMEFPDRPRPPVQQEQREGCWPQARLMNEMHSDPGHGTVKCRNVFSWA